MTDTTNIIRDKYAETARSGLSSDDANVKAVAEAFGYSADELAAIPAQANMGLSCGNPIALANLNPGETVVDLGSGGGLDVFLAASKVGPAGKAIGIDMTQDMIDLAQRNAQQGPGGKPYDNVEFHLGSIDALPLPDACADVVISNCVINLAPDKTKVFSEMFRVLKPGGRVAVSDIVLKQQLPDELAQNVAALVGCIAGAIKMEEYEGGLRDAGFDHVTIIDSGADLTAYAKVEGQSACCTPPEASPPEALPPEAPLPEASASPETAASCCGGAAQAPAPVSLGIRDASRADCCTSDAPDQAPSAKPMHRDLGDLLRRYDVNAYAASCKIFALKP